MQAFALSTSDAALRALLGRLEHSGYEFVPPTPATHRRVLARDPRPARTIRDVLGWSRPFARDAVPAWLFEALEAGDVLASDRELFRSEIRVARLGGELFIHSAFPTEAPDSVFFGPDSYRFADFIRRELGQADTSRIVDVGAGAGVGAIVAGRLHPSAEVTATDINPAAVRYARINAAHAGLEIQVIEADGLEGLATDPTVVMANPPYMAASRQTYRDGGGRRGEGLSLQWSRAALSRLRPGGRLLLYTGSAIEEGRDPLRRALSALADSHGAAFAYHEVDPDVFGEELEQPAYVGVERIAAVTCVMVLP